MAGFPLSGPRREIRDRDLEGAPTDAAHQRQEAGVPTEWGQQPVEVRVLDAGRPTLLAEVDLEIQAVSLADECPFAVQSRLKIREVEERSVDWT